MSHSACSVGSEQAVTVGWLLTDRCLAGGQMAVDKCKDGEQGRGSKGSLTIACFYSATGSHSSQTQTF